MHGVGDVVGVGQVGVAGEGVAGLAVDEESDLDDLGEVGVEGGDDGSERQVFGFYAGGVSVGEGFGQVHYG